MLYRPSGTTEPPADRPSQVNAAAPAAALTEMVRTATPTALRTTIVTVAGSDRSNGTASVSLDPSALGLNTGTCAGSAPGKATVGATLSTMNWRVCVVSLPARSRALTTSSCEPSVATSSGPDTAVAGAPSSDALRVARPDVASVDDTPTDTGE